MIVEKTIEGCKCLCESGAKVATYTGLKQGLDIALIVLVVVLVIVGLIMIRYHKK
jgi:hypothetical protein